MFGGLVAIARIADIAGIEAIEAIISISAIPAISAIITYHPQPNNQTTKQLNNQKKATTHPAWQPRLNIL